MKRLSLTPKKPNQQKHSTLDSVSASQLLKALHTLESINIIQEQIDDDLNISFSQKDTFSHDGLREKEPLQASKTNNTHSNTKNTNPNHPSKQGIQSSAPKSRTIPQVNKNKENFENDSINGKMNFEFYMSKKQHTALGQLKNRSRSPRPSQAQQSRSHTKKNLQNTIANTAKKSKQNMNPTTNEKDVNYSHNRTVNLNEEQDNRYNKSISPLTERSMNVVVKKNDDKINSIVNKELRLKTQTNERQSMNYQKRHTKAHSTLLHLPQQDPFNKTSVTTSTIATKEPKTSRHIDIEPTGFLPNTSKKLRPSIPISNPLHNLSMHERNKQYLRQKNQRLAKLCQEMQQKKRQQEKQCTFKPKMINDNTHIKPKYNDLCVSRELMERGHKKCKQGKENANYQQLIGVEWNDSNSKATMCTDVKHNKGKYNKKPNSNEQSIQKMNEESLNLQSQKQAETIVKSKYKNSKFNILLDLIH